MFLTRDNELSDDKNHLNGSRDCYTHRSSTRSFRGLRVAHTDRTLDVSAVCVRSAVFKIFITYLVFVV